MLLVLSALACVQPSPVVGEALSDGGSWWVSLEQTAFDQGEVEVALLVQTAGEGAPALGLEVLARPDMDTMGHSEEVSRLSEDGDGRYAGALRFPMSGLWTLSGYLSDGVITEGYALVVEVTP